MEILKQIWKWINWNRFIVIAPAAGLVLWFIAVGCVPTEIDPTDPSRRLSAPELDQTFALWQAQQEFMILKFEQAAESIEQQQQQWTKVEKILLDLASGSVADWPGLLKIIIGSGLVGAVADNVRKRGLIAGLKRNGH